MFITPHITTLLGRKNNNILTLLNFLSIELSTPPCFLSVSYLFTFLAHLCRENSCCFGYWQLLFTLYGQQPPGLLCYCRKGLNQIIMRQDLWGLRSTFLWTTDLWTSIAEDIRHLDTAVKSDPQIVRRVCAFRFDRVLTLRTRVMFVVNYYISEDRSKIQMFFLSVQRALSVHIGIMYSSPDIL